MAMFFSPSLTALIGNRVWWPGHADRRPEPAAPTPAEPGPPA
jgi:RND superfamily putative drug exporter